MIRSTLLGLALLALVACQSDPGLRVVTRPDQATLTFPEAGRLQLVSPADIPPGFGPDDRIVVEKAGYITFDGPMSELARIADNTYECVLVPLGD